MNFFIKNVVLNNLQIGKIDNIPIKLNITFIYFLLLLIFINYSLNLEANSSLTFLFNVFISFIIMVSFAGHLLLHELGHVFAAKHFKIKTNSINLNMFGALALLKDEPKTAKANCYISIAGPFVSVIIILLYMLLAIANNHFLNSFFISRLCIMNIVIGKIILIFNMLPMLPLDGGRFLYSIIWWIKDQTTAYKIIFPVSKIMLFLTFSLKIFWGGLSSLPINALFFVLLYLAVLFEEKDFKAKEKYNVSY